MNLSITVRTHVEVTRPHHRSPALKCLTFFTCRVVTDEEEQELLWWCCFWDGACAGFARRRRVRCCTGVWVNQPRRGVYATSFAGVRRGTPVANFHCRSAPQSEVVDGAPDPRLARQSLGALRCYSRLTLFTPLTYSYILRRCRRHRPLMTIRLIAVLGPRATADARSYPIYWKFVGRVKVLQPIVSRRMRIAATSHVRRDIKW